MLHTDFAVGRACVAEGDGVGRERKARREGGKGAREGGKERERDRDRDRDRETGRQRDIQREHLHCTLVLSTLPMACVGNPVINSM